MSVPIVYAKDTPHEIVPWAQGWADEASTVAHVKQHSTYTGHSPDSFHALDSFPASPTEGDKLARWSALPEVRKRHGSVYTIWSFNRRTGSIENRDVAPGVWREMRDRGSKTANHVDHVHNTFDTTAPAQSAPQPTEDDDMKMYHPKNGPVIFLVVGDTYFGVPNPDRYYELVAAGVSVVEIAPAAWDLLTSKLNVK